jgi:superfamily I DNA/RNA helicase
VEVFDADSWIQDSKNQETAKLDMELLQQKALEMVVDLEGEEENEIGTEAMLMRLARQLRYQIATREPFVSKGETASLQVATLWGAKGVTADHVYILGLCEEAIPGKRKEGASGSCVG